jgi:hypothetical protein
VADLALLLAILFALACGFCLGFGLREWMTAPERPEPYDPAQEAGA